MKSSSSTSTLKTKKTTVKKDPEDSIPLPSPFPLPKYYPYGVEQALNSKQMTRETTTKFMSCIAGAMLNYKRYPTSQDYNNVAQTVIDKYPHLKSPTGSKLIKTWVVTFVFMYRVPL